MDEKLIQKAIGGSCDAFVKLYGEYKDDMYRYALYRLGNPEDAEDAVSECVLAAWQGIRKLRSPAAFRTWLFRILSACCAKHIKQAMASRGNLERICREGPYREDASSPSASAELTDALMQLKEDEREIVLLDIVAGFSSREIAEMTGMSAGSVRSKLSRSLAKMRDYMS